MSAEPAATAEAARAPRTEPRPVVLEPQGDVLVLSSEALFAGHAEVRIEHHGAIYRLKHTSLGKLILTK